MLGCHLAEKLVKGFLAAAELHALEIIGIYPHTKTVEPLFFIKGRRDCNGFRTTSCITTPRLVNKVGGKATPQEDILKSLPSVRCGFPRFGELTYTVCKNKWVFPCINRLLIEYIGMVAVIVTPQ